MIDNLPILLLLQPQQQNNNSNNNVPELKHCRLNDTVSALDFLQHNRARHLSALLQLEALLRMLNEIVNALGFQREMVWIPCDAALATFARVLL